MVPRIILLLGVLVTIAGMFLGPSYVQWRGLSAAGNVLVAGPTHDGAWFIAPWFLAMGYLLFSTVVLGWPTPRRGKVSLGFRDLVDRLCSGNRGRITSIVLVSCSIAACYGTSAYWYATADRVTIHQGWGVGTVRYPWTDVSERFIGCIPMRLDYYLRFNIEMADGRSIDLASARQTNFSRNFLELLKLSNNANTKYGDLQHCPAVYRGVLKRLSFEHGAILGES